MSEVTLALVTSQRLWSADYNRMAQDLAANVTALMGFERGEEAHVEAIQAANAREVRRTQLRWLVPLFVFGGERFAERTRAAILDFKNNLPYEYEEQRDVQAAREYLTKQALEYAELADPKNYRAYRTDKDTGQIAIAHVSPTASAPEQVAKVEEAKLRLQGAQSLGLGVESLRDRSARRPVHSWRRDRARKDVSTTRRYSHRPDRTDEELGMRRGAVASVAAIALNFRQSFNEADLDWARAVLKRALLAPEKRGPGWFYGAHHSLAPRDFCGTRLGG